MERLTFEGNFCDIAQCTAVPCRCDNNCSQKQTWERLKAYEDTGLTPEEIKDLIYRFEKFRVVHAVLCDPTGQPICAPMRMKELAEADKDGRLVVLPCKVGDTVYVNGAKRTVQATIDEAYLDDVKGLEYLVSFACENDCDGCPFNDWRQDYSGEYSCDGEWGQAAISGADFSLRDFDKTVFLTREEAEAALKEALKDG